MNFEQFKANVIQWATDRNFFAKNGATLSGQIKKGISECGELADNLAKGRNILDDIGDNCVVAINVATLIDPSWELAVTYKPQGIDKSTSDEILSDLTAEWAGLLMSKTCFYCECILNLCSEMAEAHGLNIEDCYEKAWNDIKDRKGIMRNGTFIKQADLDKEAQNVSANSGSPV